MTTTVTLDSLQADTSPRFSASPRSRSPAPWVPNVVDRDEWGGFQPPRVPKRTAGSAYEAISG